MKKNNDDMFKEYFGYENPSFFVIYKYRQTNVKMSK